MTQYQSKASALEVAYRFAAQKRNAIQHEWEALQEAITRTAESLIEASHEADAALKAWKAEQAKADAPTVAREEKE